MTPASVIEYLKKARKAVAGFNERESRHGLSALSSYCDFLWSYVRYGCLINQYVNGNFSKYSRFERRKIMTYRRICEFINKCNSPGHIYKLENKVEFNKHFAKFVKRSWLSSSHMTRDDFENLCRISDQLIVKPLDDCEGRGIELMLPPCDIDGRNLLFEKLKDDKCHIEERIYNHDKLVFNNKSINTIRINSLTDRNGRVHLFKPVLRVGVGDQFVDNYNAGGCEYAVDVNTGVIISECYYNYGFNGVTHPGCDIIMPGYRIPMWEELKKTVEEACRMIPECRFIGWDVAITADGVQLIEGNHNPGNVGIEYFGETGWYGKLKNLI